MEGLPIASKIVPHLNMKFVIGGYTGRLTGDEEYYMYEVASVLSDEKEEEFANWKMKDLATNSQSLAEDLLDLTLHDVQEVLHHHLIFHGGPWGNVGKYQAIGFFHTPTIQVW